MPLASWRPTTCQTLHQIASHATISNGGQMIMNPDATMQGDRTKNSTCMRLLTNMRLTHHRHTDLLFRRRLWPKVGPWFGAKKQTSCKFLVLEGWLKRTEMDPEMQPDGS